MWKACSSVLSRQSSDGAYSTDDIYMLQEARNFYGNNRPPFVFGSKQKNFNGSHKNVILADNGEFPKEPESFDLVGAIWDEKAAFYTISSHGQRYIVKSFSGRREGGASYKRWMGPNDGFEDYAIAFTKNKADDLHEEKPKSYRRRSSRVRNDALAEVEDSGEDVPVMDTREATTSSEEDPPSKRQRTALRRSSRPKTRSKSQLWRASNDSTFLSNVHKSHATKEQDKSDGLAKTPFSTDPSEAYSQPQVQLSDTKPFSTNYEKAKTKMRLEVTLYQILP